MPSLEQAAPKKTFLTLKEAAGLLQISPRYLQRIINGEKLDSSPRVLKFGRAYRLPRDDFIKWALSHAVPSRRKS